MATPLDILTLLGKYGYGAVAQTELDPDLLCYLQMCPSWNSLAMEHLQQRTKVSGCLTAEEAALCLKTEIPGIVDEENPPKCRSLNSDNNLQPIPSKRLAAFVPPAGSGGGGLSIQVLLLCPRAP